MTLVLVQPPVGSTDWGDDITTTTGSGTATATIDVFGYTV